MYSGSNFPIFSSSAAQENSKPFVEQVGFTIFPNAVLPCQCFPPIRSRCTK
jgi:hypothetical protein